MGCCFLAGPLAECHHFKTAQMEKILMKSPLSELHLLASVYKADPNRCCLRLLMSQWRSGRDFLPNEQVADAGGRQA